MKNGKRSPVGERIAQARQAPILFRVQLAEKLGVTQLMVSYLEWQSVTIRPGLFLQQLQLREAWSFVVGSTAGAASQATTWRLFAT